MVVFAILYKSLSPPYDLFYRTILTSDEPCYNKGKMVLLLSYSANVLLDHYRVITLTTMPISQHADVRSVAERSLAAKSKAVVPLAGKRTIGVNARSVCGFAFGRAFSTTLDTKNHNSNIAKSVRRSTKPRLTQNRCYQLALFYHSTTLISNSFQILLVRTKIHE
jgi:hypothetical protein